MASMAPQSRERNPRTGTRRAGTQTRRLPRHIAFKLLRKIICKTAAETWYADSVGGPGVTENLCPDVRKTDTDDKKSIVRRATGVLTKSVQVFITLDDAVLRLFQSAVCFGTLRSPMFPARHILLKEHSSPTVVVVGKQHPSVQVV
jgi:hypothetical protein